MKTLNKAVVMGLVLFGIVGCAQPNNSKFDHSDLGNKNESKEEVEHVPESMQSSVDSLNDYKNYASVIEARFILNDENLKEMSKNLKSEVNAIQLEYDQQLKDLNERNLKIKTNVNELVGLDQESWDLFKKSTNNEMNELEKSIKALAEKVS